MITNPDTVAGAARASASSASPASSLEKIPASSWPFVPIRPLFRTRRIVPKEIALNHQPVKAPNALLRSCREVMPLDLHDTPARCAPARLNFSVD